MGSNSSKIHPSAIIENGAEIGQEVEIGPYTCIGSHVKIGDKCRIGSHVVLEGYTTLGSENTVFQFASVGSPPQDLKYRGESTTLVIGSKNIVREFVTLQPGTVNGLRTTTIGNGNLFMANCHVAHDCMVGNNNVFANSSALGGHVDIGSHVILGGLVGVHQFCRIGSYSILSGGTMISVDAPPYSIVQGDRAHLCGVNVLALKRAGISSNDISEIRKAYRLLFSTNGFLRAKVESFPQELAQRPLIRALLDFIVSSKRGVCNRSKTLSSDSDSEEHT